ncbi:MAG: hypothetical protein H6551_00235 [Chitinophagales bacterium]|nr:hypothetical protein [Chitinophagaceae bacterium]MCB9063549.1 hypothetical protein [Chitinophagales bacterium]
MKKQKHIHSFIFSIIILFGVTLTSCDPCKNVDCQNGGTCDDGKCKCPTGAEGPNCETVYRDAFLGSYIGTNLCQGSNVPTDDTVIISRASDPNQFLIDDFLLCTMTGANSFSFDYNFFTRMKGTGTIQGNTLNYTYDISSEVDSFVFTCTFEGSR